MNKEEIQAFLLHLIKDRKLSFASIRLHLNAIRFFYLNVLHWDDLQLTLPAPKVPQRIPELLSRDEVARILGAAGNLKHRTLLVTCYGCGLRVSELVSLRVKHIDSEGHLLRIEQAKGAKDRQVILPASVLRQLRRYWQRYRPADWLFPGREFTERLSISAVQRIFQRAKNQAGIEKVGGIHSLRHAYATHQLEAGMPIHQLQRLLGHNNLQSTMRYVHWMPRYRQGQGIDLLATVEV